MPRFQSGLRHMHKNMEDLSDLHFKFQFLTFFKVVVDNELFHEVWV